jgi:hypothetical protein
LLALTNLPHGSPALFRWSAGIGAINPHDEKFVTDAVTGPEAAPEIRVGENWANYITDFCRNCDNTETIRATRRNRSLSLRQ